MHDLDEDGKQSAGFGHNSGAARDGNWIAVSRELIEHHIVGAGNVVTPADKNRGAFSRLESWLDLLCMANFAERKVTVAGATQILQPGQTLAGRAFLAKRWNWSEKTVRVWLVKLEAELMITLACEKLKEGQTKGHGPNVLTICNWGRFQTSPLARGPDLGRPQGHPRATQGPHYNKETIKQLDTEGDAREGETHVGNGVFVNCEAIRHRDFPISLKAIHMGVMAGARPFDEIKARCLSHALQWAEEIAQGKPARDVVPGKISNFLIRTIMNDINAEACSEVRLERAAKGAPARRSQTGKQETEWERMSRLMGEPSRKSDEIEIIPPMRRS